MPNELKVTSVEEKNVNDCNSIWLELLQRELTPKRLAHSLSVAQYASELAGLWGVSPKQAYQAGLLHDLMHCKSPDELLSLAEENDLEIGKTQRDNPSLLHGPVAAAVLKQKYGFCDEDVLDAIRFHTIPDAGMDDLAKLIYLADMLEPTRPVWDGQDDLRRLLRTDLDQAMVAALIHTKEYVQQNGGIVHPATDSLIDAFAVYRKQI